MRVVVVDDSHVMALLLVGMLNADRGVEATAVTAGFAGLRDPARWEGVDAAVCDNQLGVPGMRGLDLLCWLRENVPGVRRVLLTTDEITDDLHECADVFLRKPASGPALFAALGRPDAHRW